MIASFLVAWTFQEVLFFSSFTIEPRHRRCFVSGKGENFMSSLHIDLPKGIETILTTLHQAGFEAVLVGGCVRDALMDRTPHDFDIATSATPQQVQSLFAHTVPVGIAHGTVLVLEKGVQAEVTTFRKESEYEDFRHPKQVEFVEDLTQDLARRDFTINAMAWSMDKGLIDPFHGQDDLKKGLIRTVGDPNTRFQEDALRILRAFRFMGRFGFNMEEKTRQAIEKQAPLIEHLAAERVAAEIQDILATSPQVLDEMTEILKPWLPELEKMEKRKQNSVYHYTDVFHHTLDALKSMPYFDPSIAWALLLHDSGKIKAHQFYDGHDHFKGHPEWSVKLAREAFKRLKLSKKVSEEALKLIALHDTFYATRLDNLYKLRVRHGLDDELVQKLFVVQYCDIMAHAQHDRLEKLKNFYYFYEAEKDKHPFNRKDLKIHGQDITDNTALQGAQIAKSLDALLKEVIEQPKLDSKEEQLAWIKAHEAEFLQIPVHPLKAQTTKRAKRANCNQKSKEKEGR